MAITQIRFRRGTTAEWDTYDPILAAGEPGVDTTTDRLKLGDGENKWSDLPWQSFSTEQLTTALDAIDAQTVTATAAANAAEQSAEQAQAAADAVTQAIAGVGSVNDTSIASSVSTTGTATNTALKNAYARKRTEDISNLGVPVDGTPVAPTVIQNALNAGTPLVLSRGTLVLTSGINAVSGGNFEVAEGAKLLRAWAGGSGNGGALFKNTDFGVKVNDFMLWGKGTIAALDDASTGAIVALNGDRNRFIDFTVSKWQGSRAFVLAGDDIVCRGLDVFGSSHGTNNGGIRVVGGKGFRGSNCRVLSGDDALQFVPGGNSNDANLYNLSIEDAVWENSRFGSYSARGMVAGIENAARDNTLDMTCSIRNITFSNCTGFGGIAAVVISNSNSTGYTENIRIIGGVSDMEYAETPGLQAEINVIANMAGHVRNVFISGHRVDNPRVSTVKSVGQVDGLTLDSMHSVRGSVQPTYGVYQLTGTDIKVTNGSVDGAGTAAPVIDCNASSGGDHPERPVFRDLLVKNIGPGQKGILSANSIQPSIRSCTFTPAVGAETTAQAWQFPGNTSDVTAKDNNLTALTGSTKYTDSSTGTRTVADNRPLVNGTVVVSSDDVGYDVILCAGQSNMVGYGNTIDPNIDIADPRIMQWPSTGPYVGQVIPANDPLYSHQGQIGLGHAMTFAREYVRHIPENRQVLLVPTAHGATPFSNPDNLNGYWDHTQTGAGPNLAIFSVNQVLDVLALDPNNRYVGALWHQGEADATRNQSTAQYVAYWDEWDSYLRTAIPGASDKPHVLGQMLPEGIDISPAKQLINAAHIATPGRRVLTGFWYGQRGGPVAGSDDHYDSIPNRVNGRSAYKAWVFAKQNISGTPPVVIPTVTLAQTGAGTAVATWEWPGGRVTSFTTQVSINGAAFTTVTPNDLTLTRTLTGLTTNQTVVFRVRSNNEFGSSAYTNSSQITVAGGPAQVTGVSVSAITGSGATVSWSSVATATSYNIEVSANAGSTWTLNNTSATTSGTVSGLTAGANYQVRVIAVSSAGNGIPSVGVPFTTSSLGPLMTGVTATGWRLIGLRKLTASATQCIRVRRASDDTQTDIGFSGNNLDESALTTFSAAGDAFIVTWYDQSGNSRHLTETATTARQAKIVSAGVVNKVNGKPHANFNGTSNGYANTANLGLWSAGAATANMVGRGSSTSIVDLIGEQGAGAAPLYRLLSSSAVSRNLTFFRDDANSLFVNSGSSGALLTGTGNVTHQVTNVDNGSNVKQYMDGVLVDLGAYTRTGHTFTATRTYVGWNGATTSPVFFNGDIAEMCWFTTALSDADRTAIAANQKSYYGTP